MTEPLDDARGELLACCPFCRAADIQRNSNRWGHFHFCGCGAGGPYGETPAKAFDLWNTRAALVPKCEAEPVALEDIAQTLCAVDGNGFLQDASATQRAAYEIRARAVAALYATPPSRSDAGSAPLRLPTPAQIEPILDDFLGVDSPYYEELRKRCAQRIFDLCVVTSGIPIRESDNGTAP